MKKICGNDGKEMELVSVQLCKPERAVRLWYLCKKCQNGITEEIPYETEPEIIINEV